MNNENANNAANLLLKDPETGEELRPFTDPQSNNDGSFSLRVENQEGSRKWMHTIKTEEL